MTPNDIALVQSSFARIAPISDETGANFYARLFDIAPELRPLFRGDMDEQGRMFMAMLTVAVNGLGAFDFIRPALGELAMRHAGYGVKAEHYGMVGAALICILEQNLGADFTDEVRSAWLSVYRSLSGAMIEAAYGGEA